MAQVSIRRSNGQLDQPRSRIRSTHSYHESFKAGDTERSALDVSVRAHCRRPRGMVHQSLFSEVFACKGVSWNRTMQLCPERVSCPVTLV